jgi:DNA-binding transcriptional ArsR family regulator
LDKAEITAIYKLHAEFCKTLADANRLLIIVELSGGKEVSVNILAERLGLPQANVSKHLAIMRERGMVLSRREGVNIFYSLADERIYDAIRLLIDVQAELLNRRHQMARGITTLASESRRG